MGGLRLLSRTFLPLWGLGSKYGNVKPLLSLKTHSEIGTLLIHTGEIVLKFAIYRL